MVAASRPPLVDSLGHGQSVLRAYILLVDLFSVGLDQVHQRMVSVSGVIPSPHGQLTAFPMVFLHFAGVRRYITLRSLAKIWQNIGMNWAYGYTNPGECPRK